MASTTTNGCLTHITCNPKQYIPCLSFTSRNSQEIDLYSSPDRQPKPLHHTIRIGPRAWFLSSTNAPKASSRSWASSSSEGGLDAKTGPNTPLLGIPPDLGTDGLPPGLGDGIVKASKAIDEMVPTIQPQPDLESTVVVPHPRRFLQHPSPLHGLRA